MARSVAAVPRVPGSAPVCFSIFMLQLTWGGKSLFHLTGHSLSLRAIRGGTEAETMEVCIPWFDKSAFLYNPGLHARDGTAHIYLNLKNKSKKASLAHEGD